MVRENAVHSSETVSQRIYFLPHVTNNLVVAEVINCKINMRSTMNKQSSFIMISHNPLESGILSDHVVIKVVTVKLF